MSRHTCLTVLALALIVLQAPAAPPASVPAPSFTRVQYDHPDRYLALTESFGDAKLIRDTAAPLKGAAPEASLRNIHAWMQKSLTCDPSLCYAWRKFDDVLETRAYGGCADYAIAFAALARACGIPAVFVKTMDADWIREFRAAGKCQSWRGHVFLEVHLNGKWRLLDPGALTLYDDYATAARILPGPRWAYDKGGDPKALLLSLDWERWKTQTAGHFKNFDVSQLPVAGGIRVGGNAIADDAPAQQPARGTLYIAADSPVWQAVVKRARARGFSSVQSFNEQFDQYLPKARGGDLVVACVGTRITLPPQHHGEMLPVQPEEIQTRMQKSGAGTARRTLPDGTRVTLVYGPDAESVVGVVKTLELPSNDE